MEGFTEKGRYFQKPESQMTPGFRPEQWEKWSFISSEGQVEKIGRGQESVIQIWTC